jgi:glycosyltransferase involved in cell wall biosynthesis
MPSAAENLNIALFPGVPWLPEIASYQAGQAPDPLLLFEVMKESGIHVDIIDPYPLPANPFARSNQLYRGLDFVRAADVMFRRRKYDLILSVFESSALFPLLLRKLSPSPPLVAIWDIGLTDWRALKVVQSVVLPRVDHIFVLSTYQIHLLKEQWSRHDGVTFVGQHLDTDFYRPDPDVEEEDYILAIGEDAGRDFATLLKAAPQLPANLVIKTKRALNIPPALRGRVRQISSWLDWSDLKKLYASCKMVVVPLHATGNVSGVGSALEAMAMAKPLVVSNNPAMVDYLRDRHNCLVVPPHDPGALAQAVNRMLADPALAGALGRRARDFVIQNHSQRVFARHFADTIRSVVDAARAEGRTRYGCAG